MKALMVRALVVLVVGSYLLVCLYGFVAIADVEHLRELVLYVFAMAVGLVFLLGLAVIQVRFEEWRKERRHL